MAYQFTLRKQNYLFDDLKSVLAKASPLRSGDALAGLPLKVFLNETVVPYELDEVTRLIIDTHDFKAFDNISHFTVGDLRDWLLEYTTSGQNILEVSKALTPEMVAAVCKLMRNQDLIAVTSKIQVITRYRNTVGLWLWRCGYWY